MSDENFMDHGQILLYQTADGRQRIEVHLQEETVWLSQEGMAELFQTTPQNVNIHLKNIFSEGELSEESVVKESLITAADGKKYRTQLYRLEGIISVGYRVSSHRGTQFRQWATKRLKEYIVKGFALDDERLSKSGGMDYFDELLDRIRAIRASEKRFYQKIRDIYTLSADYDPQHLPAKPQYGYPVDRTRMLLSMMRALWGEVSPELRSASIKWNDHCVYVYFFYDGPISEENEESAQCVATEVIACFPEHQLEVNIQRLDYPHLLPQDVGELVYRRREAKPC